AGDPVDLVFSLHDALPISWRGRREVGRAARRGERVSEARTTAFEGGKPPPIMSAVATAAAAAKRLARKCERAISSPCVQWGRPRSEEHTSELQSPYDLVCR